MRSTETVEECAVREIKKEAGLEVNNLKYIGAFSEIDRDLRGRVVSNSYLSIINGTSKVMGDTDAKDAMWFDVKYSADEKGITLELYNKTEKLFIIAEKN